MDQTLEIIEVDDTRLQEVLGRAEQALTAEDARLLRALFRSYAYVAELVDNKNTTIHRLRRLFFGARTEKTAAVLAKADEASKTDTRGGSKSAVATRSTGAAAPSKQAPEVNEKPAAKGHGRNGADSYPGAERIKVANASLSAGDACPTCHAGTVYNKAPGMLVRIIGQAPLQAKIYELQKLRCHLCGELFGAAAPEEAGSQKYDATAGSMIGLLKYGTGFPFHRLEGTQEHLEMPLPASTQWDIVHAVAANITPAYDELIRQAAQGEVLHNDDTTVKILSLMGKKSEVPAESKSNGQDEINNADQRKGLFTSGVVALMGAIRVALFFSGRRHAGENLAAVLKHRAAELPPPIQMCDALSRNMPAKLRTIIANCLAHARRNFVDVVDRFPEQCRYLLEALAVVYRNDALAQENELSAQARLEFHQRESGPTMVDLKAWLQRQLDDKLAEPNSPLGGAIRYMLNHWEKLTLFLRQAGAPLDNNICERALKKAILHRKNALFYKTLNGARVGDLFMSLIYTCQLNEANPFDYLTQLQRHTDELAANPALWMPWNYRAALADPSTVPK
jgi:transposase